MDKNLFLQKLSDKIYQKDPFWLKIKEDLKHGFQIKGIHPDYMDSVVIWTKFETEKYDIPSQFLIIATGRQALKHPVGAVEMHAYSKGKYSWRMQLNRHPFPQPHFSLKWQVLRNIYPESRADEKTVQMVTETYLSSVIDEEKTEEEFSSDKYPESRKSWVTIK